MLDPFGQAWQSGSALAAQTLGRATANKEIIFGSLLMQISKPQSLKDEIFPFSRAPRLKRFKATRL